jgi:phage shock protein PspC (stress-responsive transcriptional regulator)
MNRRLYRSLTDKVIGGVAGGVAQYLDVDPSIVRVVWALLALLTGGVFFVLYIVMWIVVPVAPGSMLMPPEGGDAAAGEPGAASPSSWSGQSAQWARQRSGGGPWIFGLVLIGLGAYFLVREYFPEINLDRLWPLGLVLLGVLLLFVALRRHPE